MKKQKYNWWDDPKNADEVRKISWWEHPENKISIELPVSIINDGTYWCIGTNNETKHLLGEGLTSISASGGTKEEAISNFFSLLKFSFEHEHQSRLKYQRWVPFRKGYWKHIGGKWVVIFGIHVYFRTGKNMKGGWYVPFTKLNVMLSNEWKIETNKQ